MQYRAEGGICHEKTQLSRRKASRAHPGIYRGSHAHSPDAAVVVLVAGGRNRLSLRWNLAFEEMSKTGGAKVKIVVVKSPKILRGILRKIFGIK